MRGQNDDYGDKSCVIYLVTSGRALVTSACGETGTRARVGSIGRRDRVRLPDIHLGAASTVLTAARVGRGTVPAEDVSL